VIAQTLSHIPTLIMRQGIDHRHDPLMADGCGNKFNSVRPEVEEANVFGFSSLNTLVR
jgi:hypothetical protein